MTSTSKISIFTLLQFTLISLLFTPSALAQSVDLELIDETPIPTNSLPQSPINPHKKSPNNNTTNSPKIGIKLSNHVVNFGILTPTNPIIRYSKIYINSDSSFYLQSSQNSYLNIEGKNSFIPNTSCDNGICNDTDSGPWTSTLTYGLGVRCINLTPTTSCLINGENDEYNSLPLSDTSLTIGKGFTTGSFKITYKINTAPTQPTGNYTNTIYYILIPSL